MRFAYAASFYKNIRNLSKSQGAGLLKNVRKFQNSWEAGKFPPGLGLTHLHGQFFEFRAGIHKRILFMRSGDLIYYLLYGSHDDIRRFLKRM